MIAFPNAKINLGLNVVSRCLDGYHNIETIFYPVRLFDVLEIVPSEIFTFTQTGILVGGDLEQNLVMKAFHLLKAQYKLPELTVYLQKNIPFGAGFGGGSADAAFMLKLLNDYAGLCLSIQQLEGYAAQIGSDCPFFIQNEPVFAEGKGNVFSPTEVILSGYYLLLVKPAVHISTLEAYAQVRPHKPKQSIRDVIRDPIDTWKGRLTNDFEVGVFSRFPEIGALKQRLYDCGALYASMSGSGSALFGIFDEKPADEMLAEWQMLINA